MWQLILITIFIYGLFYYWLEKKLKILLYRERTADFSKLNKDFDSIKAKQEKLTKNVRQLSGNLEATMALYEVTKDVCKTLDEEEVFEIFKDKVEGVLGIKECLFIKKEASGYKFDQEKEYLFNVKIDSKSVGTLVAKGITERKEKERFNILAQQFLLGFKRAMLYHRVQELSITDSLTQLLNRRYFLKRLDEEIQRAKQFKLNFAFLMGDIDNFKEYNDRFGHLVGDMVLKETSAVITESTRRIDLVGRYGGEEFAVLLPETSQEGAYFVAERIRSSLESKAVKAYDEELKVKISIGLCTYPRDAKTASEIIDKSDFALYDAKAKGKNQVCIYQAKRSK